jgi:hypothetical protein
VADITVTLPNRERHSLTYSWIQHSEPMKDVAAGMRVRFTAKVRSYVRRDTNETAYGFAFPANVEVVTRPIALVAVAEAAAEVAANRTGKTNAAPPPKPTPLELLVKSRQLMDTLGGKDRVQALLGAVEGIGGWDRLTDLLGLANELGGPDQLRQLVDLL